VFTFSMHQEANYPAWKPPSDLDLGLANGTGDDEYLALLRKHLPAIVDRHRPELAFYLAGADPYELDQLGGLGLTLTGLRRRDELVIRMLREGGAAVAVVLAGGYAIDANDTVEIHANTVRAASTMPR
jgi:acetoin utilization deacetylase AcuC-like enzyme